MPSTHHRKHAHTSMLARKHAKHVRMQARKHVSTQARKHAKHVSTQSRQAHDLADSSIYHTFFFSVSVVDFEQVNVY